ncbi:MAG: glycosyl hydrolase family 8 [Pseudomonadota bacterium]
MKRRRAFGCVLLSALLASALSGCSGTLDSLGTDAAAHGSLGSITGPPSYPNTFRSLLKKNDGEIANKISAGFDQLFHGDPTTQAIYYEMADDHALIYDVLHNDVRTEGIGLAMLITVELDKQDEFDRLWRYSKDVLLERSGPAQGYFSSLCNEGTQGTPCFDVYGMQQFVLALMLANNRWQSSTAQPYANDALALLDLLQNKEVANGGVVAGIASAFDPTTHLVREEPTLAAAGYTRTALEMPAVYELWAQATGNAFWNDAADAARAHLLAASDATTGLWPIRSYFDGTPVADSSTFTAQAYRTHLNLAMDALWGTAGAGQTAVADRVLGFFNEQGLDKYGQTFTLDGTPIDANRAQALISVNGALAVASSRTDRVQFVEAIWAQAIPSGDNRYYDGLLYLMSLLVLSGQLRVY